MRALPWLAVAATILTACGSLPASSPREVSLPPGVFGVYEDNDIGAINYAAWAFASPANTRNNPAAAARAIVALEYLPGELTDNPRWVQMDAAIPIRMAQARAQISHILGVAPNAPRQAVVNALLALTWDLQTGNQAAAMQVLQSPVFTLPPDHTLGILSNLPYIQEANLSTSRAQDQSFPPGGPRS